MERPILKPILNLGCFNVVDAHLTCNTPDCQIIEECKAWSKVQNCTLDSKEEEKK